MTLQRQTAKILEHAHGCLFRHIRSDTVPCLTVRQEIRSLQIFFWSEWARDRMCVKGTFNPTTDRNRRIEFCFVLFSSSNQQCRSYPINVESSVSAVSFRKRHYISSHLPIRLYFSIRCRMSLWFTNYSNNSFEVRNVNRASCRTIIFRFIIQSDYVNKSAIFKYRYFTFRAYLVTVRL